MFIKISLALLLCAGFTRSNGEVESSGDNVIADNDIKASELIIPTTTSDDGDIGILIDDDLPEGEYHEFWRRRRFALRSKFTDDDDDEDDDDNDDDDEEEDDWFRKKRSTNDDHEYKDGDRAKQVAEDDGNHEDHEEPVLQWSSHRKKFSETL